MEEQKARAESAETQRDALERRESSRLSTVQADAAAGQQELAQGRQRQEQRAQKAEAKLEELNLQYAQYAQELLERKRRASHPQLKRGSGPKAKAAVSGGVPSKSRKPLTAAHKAKKAAGMRAYHRKCRGK